MSRFSNSMDLAKASVSVLKQDKELAAIPLAATITNAVIAVVFGGGAYFTLDHIANPQPGQDAWSATPLTYVVGVVGLLLIGLVAQFFAATLVAGANQRLSGGSPTLSSALAVARSRLGAILGWAIMNLTVGLILNAIRDKAGFLGDLAAGALGAAWNVITWLVVPVIVVEDAGPITATKRSAHLLKQTWGENVIAQMGLGIIGFLAMLPGVLVFGGLSLVLPVVGIPLLLVYVAIVGSIMAALGGIYRTALYRYAAGLPAGEAFSEAELVGAFRKKGSRATSFLR